MVAQEEHDLLKGAELLFETLQTEASILTLALHFLVEINLCLHDWLSNPTTGHKDRVGLWELVGLEEEEKGVASGVVVLGDNM